MKIEEVKEMLAKVDQLLPQMSPEGALRIQGLLKLAHSALADFESHGIALEDMGDQPELTAMVQIINDLYKKYATN